MVTTRVSSTFELSELQDKVNVYSLASLRVRDSEPFGSLEPSQSPDAEQDVVFSDVQDNVALL